MVPPGFVAERVAGPPVVEYPMTASFDEQGRLFVAIQLPDAASLERTQQVADRVVVRDGDSRWQAESGQYLLAFEVTSVVLLAGRLRKPSARITVLVAAVAIKAVALVPLVWALLRERAGPKRAAFAFASSLAAKGFRRERIASRSGKLRRSSRQKPTAKPSGTAISRFTGSAISSSASSTRLSTFAPSRPDTTNWRQIFSPQFNWSRLSSFSTEDRP